MSFNPADLTAMSVALAALLTAIFTGAVNIITALRTERKVDASGKTLDSVSHSVNGTTTGYIARVDSLVKEVSELKAQIADQKQVAALLAQALVTAQAAPAIPTPAAIPLNSADPASATPPLVVVPSATVLAVNPA